LNQNTLPAYNERKNGCLLFSVVSPFYGLCEIFEKMTAIYGVLIFQKQPYMVLKQNWRNYSYFVCFGWRVISTIPMQLIVGNFTDSV
jgi:hypothetical protein